MAERTERLNAGELLFFTAYTLFIGVNILFSSFYNALIGNTVHTLMEMSSLLLLVIKEFLERNYSYRDYKSVVPVGMLILLMFINTKGLDEFAIIITLVFIWSSRNVSIERIEEYTIWLTLGAVLFVAASAEAGIITNFYTATPRLRYYMGFRYSLYAPGYVLNCALLEMVLSQKKMHWPRWVVILVMAVWLYHMTDSRMPFLLTMLAFAAVMVYKLFPSFFTNKFMSELMICSFIIFAAVGILSAVFYNEKISWMETLNSDRLLAGRLSNAQNSLNTYGVSLFGKKITWSGHGLSVNAIEARGSNYNYVDCLYVKMLQRCGVLFTAGILYCITKALRIAKKKNLYLLLIAAAILSVRCLIDDFSLFSYGNTFWFILPFLMRSEKQIKIM